MLTEIIQDREIRIIKILLKESQTTVKKIAEKLNLSEKTVSKSLKDIEEKLEQIGLSLIRKPKIGVYIEGDLKKILPYLSNMKKDLPTTKEERIIYIYSRLLKSNDYVTVTKLSEEMYISRGTIKRDLVEVENLLKEDNVILHKKVSKGMKLDLSEVEKRNLTAKFIHRFWGKNWYIKQEEEQFLQVFENTKANMDGIFCEENLSVIIDIVRGFSKVKNFKFSDYEFQSLVIHLAIAIERIKKGEFINEFYEEDKVDSKLDTTIYLVEQIEKKIDIKLPVSEIRHINLHLVASNSNKEKVNIQTEERTDDITNLKRIIESTLDESFDSDLINGLTTHIHSSINRLKHGLSIQNPFVNTVKQNFYLSFNQAIDLKKVIESIYDIVINDDECAYIALHFEAYRERVKEMPKDIKVVVVCSTGLGSSRLLSARIKKYFPNIKVEKVLSVQELMLTNIDVDLVISTIYLELENIQTVVVSPMLDEGDIRVLDRNVQNISDKALKSLEFLEKVISKENIMLDLEAKTYIDVIKSISTKLIENGYAEYGVEESAIERERLSYTSFKSMATPHANPSYIKKSTIAVATLRNPVVWGHKSVDVVFFMAIKNNEDLNLDELYEYFYDFIDSKKNINELLNSTSVDNVYKLLTRGTK